MWFVHANLPIGWLSSVRTDDPHWGEWHNYSADFNPIHNYVNAAPDKQASRLPYVHTTIQPSSSTITVFKNVLVSIPICKIINKKEWHWPPNIYLYMTNGLLIYGEIFAHFSYIRKPFLIYDFATAPLWISLYMRKIWFFLLSVYCTLSMLGLAGSTRSNSKCRVSSVGSLARASLGDRDLDLGQKVK